MALREQIVELVLRVRNSMSKGTDEAAQSVDNLADNADALKARLAELEDQSLLIKQFRSAETVVDKTATAYQKAEQRLAALEEKLGKAGPLTASQAKQFQQAADAVDRTGKAYRDAERELDAITAQADESGLALDDLAGVQARNTLEARKARRALRDLKEQQDENSRGIVAFGKALLGNTRRFATWAAGIGAAIGAAANSLARFSTGAAAFGDDINNVSTELGISAEALQEYQIAARTVGVESDQFNQILRTMTKNLGEAAGPNAGGALTKILGTLQGDLDASAEGGGAFNAMLRDIGLNVQDLVKLSPEEQLLRIGEAIDGLGTEEQVFVLDRLGEGASKLLPLLRNNASELRRVIEAARERGAVVSEEEIARLVAMQDTLNRINERFLGLRNRIVSAVAPAVEKFAIQFEEAFDSETVARLQRGVETFARIAAERITNFIASLSALEGSFQTLVDTVQFLGNGFVSVFRGVQSLVAGTLEVVARGVFDIRRGILAVQKGLNTVGLVSDETVAKSQRALENTGQLVADLEAKSERYKRQALEAGRAAVGAFDNTTAAAEETAGTIELIGENLEFVNDANTDPAQDEVEKVGDKANEASDKVKTLVDSIAEIGTRADASNAIRDLVSALDRGEISTEQFNKGLQDVQKKSEALTFERAKEGVDDLSESSEGASINVRGVGSDAQTTAKQVVILGEKGREAGENLAAGASNGSAAFAVLSGAISGYLQQMQELSGSARNAFVELASGQRVATESGDELNNRLGELRARLKEIREIDLRTADSTGLQRTLGRLGSAAARVEIRFINQQKALRDLLASYRAGEIDTRSFIQNTQNAIAFSDVLDAQTLDQYRGEIEAAQRAMQSLRDSTQGAVASLQDELDRLRGNTAAIEERRFRERIEDLEEQLEIAQRTNDAEAIANAQEALRLAKEIKAVKDAEIAAAERERAAQARERQLNGGSTSRTINTTNTTAPGGDRGTISLDLSANGQSLGTLSGIDESEANLLLDALERAGLSVGAT